MRRHTLDPEKLEVESFDSTPATPSPGRALRHENAGTVVGLSCVGISCEVDCRSFDVNCV
ncbi:MAG TPA: hypothetical protein VHG91_14510 [Longimicrobium sp.]|nr:hypothetical protein [Longimicrobium sp.]